MSKSFWWFLAAGFAAIVGLSSTIVRAECLASEGAVRAAHGVTAWSTWRNIDGHRCYMLGERKVMQIGPGKSHKQSGRTEQTGNIETTPRPANQAGAVSLPYPRFEKFATPHPSYEIASMLILEMMFEDAGFSARFDAAYGQ